MTENAQRHPSNESPMEPETFDRGDPRRRCTARRKNGERCRKWAIRGGTVCATHGGAAKHVRNAARLRLQNAADRLAKELLKMAVDDDVSDSVKLAAIKDALDRAGLNSKTEIEISASPMQQIEESVAAQLSIGGSRDAYRRSVGVDSGDDEIPESDPLAALRARDLATATRHDDGVIDALVVDVSESDRRSYPTTRDDRDWPASERTPGSADPSRPGGCAVSLVEAAEYVAHLNAYNAQRQGADRRAKVHTPQRALPPGRSDR